jgi:hypothetical protein
VEETDSFASGPAGGLVPGYVDPTLIGRGGHGEVYRAVDSNHDRSVAIKVLTDALDPTARRRFERERKAMGRLSGDPNIVTIHGSGYTSDGRAYLVMELVARGSLEQRLAVEGPIPWREAVAIVVSVARAVQAAHDEGVLHRDIKPANVLVDRFGTPKLSDFGIATSVSVTVRTEGTSAVSATIAHSAPEVLQGQPSSPAVDVYALGSTLHTLIAGSAPFSRPTDDSVAPVINRILSEPPPDLRPVGVPDGVAAAIERALAKRPEGRPASPAALAEELRSAVATVGAPGQGLPADPGAPASPAWRASGPGADTIAAAPGGGSTGSPPGSGDPATWATVPVEGAGRWAAMARPGPVHDPAADRWSGSPTSGSGRGTHHALPDWYPSSNQPAQAGPVLMERVVQDQAPTGRRWVTSERVLRVVGLLLFFGLVGGATAIAFRLAPSGEGTEEAKGVVRGERGTAPDPLDDALIAGDGTAGGEEPAGGVAGPTTAETPITVASTATGLTATASAWAGDGVDACGSPTAYRPDLAVDGREDTTWRVDGSGVGQRLEMALGGPRTITEVGLLPGYAKVDPCDGTDRFTQNRRVVAVTWTIGDQTVEQRVDPDRAEIQSIPVEGSLVVDAVVLEITETTSGDRDFAAVSEVRIAGR